MNTTIIKILKNKNSYFKFTKKELDCLIIDERNRILMKYLNMPRFKYIKCLKDKKKTKVLLLPKNSSYGLKIDDVLTFESEHII